MSDAIEQPYCLSTGIVPELTEALTLGQGFPREIGGVPCRYFWRELIRTGDFVHPANDRPIPVNADTLKNWQTQFSRMTSNGVKVYVPTNHKKSVETNRGYVKEMRIRDGRLEGLLQLIGDDAVKDCARSEISIKVEPKLKDGHGNVYERAIEHVSLVVDPVIPAQTTFEAHDNSEAALAASRGDENSGPTYILNRSIPMPSFTKLRERLGAATDVSDDALQELTLSRLDAAKTEATAAIKRAETAEAQATELSRTVTPPPDPLTLAREAGMMVREIDLSVREGDLPPVIANALKDSLKPDAPPALLLSRSDAIPGKLSPVEWVISLFKEKKLGAKRDGKEKTEQQSTLELSRKTPTDDGKANENTQEAQDEILAQSSLGRQILADRKRKAS